MTKALEGVRVVDMTHVQSGPSATQLLAWLGADVIKVEMPGRGDITRAQLRDIPDADSLYFTMLNCNKRSVTVNMKSEGGRDVFARLVRDADVLVENFGPGVLDRLGFPWESLHELNTRLILASIKGFGPGRYADFKAYEVVAQAMGGAMSTTGFEDGPPTATGAQIGDSGSGIHLVAGILAALYQRVSTGRGQRVSVAMQDAVLNLCRVKLRDQQRLARGPLEEYPNSPSGGSGAGSAEGPAADEVPRSGNASGGGQPGWAVKCAPGGPNDYIYVIIQPPGWAPITSLIGRPELADDPAWATPEARLPKLDKAFALIEEWTSRYTKWEVMEKLNAHHIPCGPILSTRELIQDETLAALGSVVSVSHPERGAFKTVGCPVRLSDSPVSVASSPLLGEHTDEVLSGLGYQATEIAALREAGAI
jgi:formyl-CoA transferase